MHGPRDGAYPDASGAPGASFVVPWPHGALRQSPTCTASTYRRRAGGSRCTPPSDKHQSHARRSVSTCAPICSFRTLCASAARICSRSAAAAECGRGDCGRAAGQLASGSFGVPLPRRKDAIECHGDAVANAPEVWALTPVRRSLTCHSLV